MARKHKHNSAPSNDLYTLRVLHSFVDTGYGTPVSLKRGDIIKRSEEVATRFVEGGLAEEVLDPIHQMVSTAAEIGGVAFVTSNAEVTAACAHYQVGCTNPGK